MESVCRIYRDSATTQIFYIYIYLIYVSCKARSAIRKIHKNQIIILLEQYQIKMCSSKGKRTKSPRQPFLQNQTLLTTLQLFQQAPNLLSGTGLPPTRCSAFRGRPGGHRNALVLGHFPFQNRNSPRPEGDFNIFLEFLVSKTQTISLDPDLHLLKSFNYQ